MVNDVVVLDRFCAYDPHGLYQRIDCLAREYMVKRKLCLTKLYMSPPSDGVVDVGSGDAVRTSTSIDDIVSTLLHEYDGLKHILETISPALVPLVRLRLFYCYQD